VHRDLTWALLDSCLVRSSALLEGLVDEMASDHAQGQGVVDEGESAIAVLPVLETR